MSNLPKVRVTEARPFENVGLDFFGPIQTKRGRVLEKRWGCLFCCLSMRAVHIEMAWTMDTDSFICVLLSFIAIRGPVSQIWSDNGSNIVGGSRELKTVLNSIDESRVAELCLKHNIEWHFTPPYAPHFGGVWERLVKSAKRALKAVLGNVRVTDEVLKTAFARVTDIMNSRPITTVSDEPTDFSAITPNCLLKGHSAEVFPLDSDVMKLCYRKRWRQTEAICNQFWRRWRKDYLPNLMTRCKWRKEQRNLQEGNLVLVSDPVAPRGRWQLGRVIQIYPGSDGRVRTVAVKTINGIHIRPASKICLLEE
nr:uncharacterized protein LOC120338123 [Styela clava]